MWATENKYLNTFYFAVSYNVTLCWELTEITGKELHDKSRAGVVCL